MAIIEFKHVSKTYFTIEQATPAIRNLNLKVNKGDFISIVGPSGCGKSTILSLLAGLMEPTKGKILLDGKNITGTSPLIGYMLQQDYLMDWRTIENNCLIGLEIKRHPMDKAKQTVRALLKKYGLLEFANHYPSQLSGGMRQRVALIRTLALNPEIVLLDEPFSALDYQTRLKLESEISSILRLENKTVILVTHDLGEAITMADKVIVLSKRPATIKGEYPVSIPKTEGLLEARETPEYHKLYHTIWKELDHND